MRSVRIQDTTIADTIRGYLDLCDILNVVDIVGSPLADPDVYGTRIFAREYRTPKGVTVIVPAETFVLPDGRELFDFVIRGDDDHYHISDLQGLEALVAVL